MSESSEIREDFIAEMGRVLESFGLPHMVGRVFSVLLIADPPEKTAQELADELQASRGAISGAIKMLELMQMVDRKRKPADRKDYFSVRPNAWSAAFMNEIMGISLLRKLAEKGLRILNSDNSKVTRGLRDMRDMTAFAEAEFPALWEKWTKYQEEKKSEGS